MLGTVLPLDLSRALMAIRPLESSNVGFLLCTGHIEGQVLSNTDDLDLSKTPIIILELVAVTAGTLIHGPCWVYRTGQGDC